jgi:hypothetical protein
MFCWKQLEEEKLEGGIRLAFAGNLNQNRQYGPDNFGESNMKVTSDKALSLEQDGHGKLTFEGKTPDKCVG